MSAHDLGRYVIRTMTADELGFAVDLAAAEGWNPGLHDAEAFYAADPGGFLVGVLDGAPVACISAVSYERRFGFIGLYIVVPEHRGKGYGLAIWNAAMERLAGHDVGLDGVVAQQDNYRKSGFTLAYGNVRFEGRGGGPAPADLIDARAVPFDRLCELDRRVFPAARPEFLRAWMDRPGGSALAAVEGDALRGYGVIRPCRVGFKIGPLVADTRRPPTRCTGASRHTRATAAPSISTSPKSTPPRWRSPTATRCAASSTPRACIPANHPRSIFTGCSGSRHSSWDRDART
jgi:GNAT superfamily N-acetyltransferase